MFLSLATACEIIFLVCFGASWPFNIIKAYKARTTKGTSLQFMSLICFGYVAGIFKQIFTLLANNKLTALQWVAVKVTVCVGSSCHLKGSRQVVEGLRQLIVDNKLEDKIDLAGTFCMGKCEQGVCVTVDGELFSVSPDTVENFFNADVLPRV